MVKAEMNARLHKIIIAVCHSYAYVLFVWKGMTLNSICLFSTDAGGLEMRFVAARKIQPPNMFL